MHYPPGYLGSIQNISSSIPKLRKKKYENVINTLILIFFSEKVFYIWEP